MILAVVLVFLFVSGLFGTITYDTSFGSSGTGNGQFSYPCGIARSSSGELYVTDRNNERVQVFTSSYVYNRQWGSVGSGNGQFWSNGGCEEIAFDAYGNVWISDRNNDRIQKFTSSGSYLFQLGTTNTPGSANGELDTPNGVAISHSNGEIYIADRNNERVQVFNNAGVYLRKWGSLGSGDGQFSSNSGCEDIALDADGNVWVTDRNNHRMQKFTNTGTYRMSLGITGSSGSADGQFSYPEGIAIHPVSGDIYVVDRNNHRIQRFNSSGVFQEKFGTYGVGDGQFSFPVDMAIDNENNKIYVVDRNNHRIVVLNIPHESPLPVTLSSFDAVYSTNTVALN